jgi:hypothetical protein
MVYAATPTQAKKDDSIIARKMVTRSRGTAVVPPTALGLFLRAAMFLLLKCLSHAAKRVKSGTDKIRTVTAPERTEFVKKVHQPQKQRSW